MTVSSSNLDLNSFISENTAYQSNILSLDDHETIESVLSGYDPENLSQNDAFEIINSFEDAGIEPSRQLSNAMSNFGFDAKDLEELTNQSQQNSVMFPNLIDKEEENDISSILENLFSDDDKEDSLSLANENISDYTSKILNLNDQSKENAMQIIEKYNQYNQEDSPYSKEDIGKLVSSSLDDILNNSNNYNRVALFA